MSQTELLDIEANELVVGKMYCCVTFIYDGGLIEGILVRYCGIDPASGRYMFADADTWDEIDVDDYDGFVPQSAGIVNPVEHGWPELSA